MRARQNIIDMYHAGLMSLTNAVKALCQCDPTLCLIQALELLA